MTEVTRILDQVQQGDPKASEQLLPLVYEELRKLAVQLIAQEKPGQTLQATALVHEAYLRIVDTAKAQCWDSRRHFFGAAAEAMRRMLIDQARRKQCAKRGGPRERAHVEEMATLPAPEGEPVEDLLALDEALRQLEAEDPVKARLVKLRYFAGTSLEDTARLMGISPATAKRYWVYARSWLYGKLHGD